MFPSEFLREIEDRCPLDEIAASYVNLKRQGKNLIGLCPFHNEKTPSFNVYPANNSFYCFGCSRGGDVINFVMGVENLDFPEAVRWLAQRAGLQVPEVGVDDSMEQLRNKVREINRESARFFYHTLSQPQGKAGLEYFKRRGLDAGTIKRFGLGYAPDSGFALVNHLRNKGYSVDEMIQADVARKSQRGNAYDRYRGRVMFPIFDLRGNVIAFGGRILTDEKPKYINTMDTPVYHKSSGLFAMNLAKNAEGRELILAEGYMDVIALHRAGFTNAIASLGTALTDEQARIIKRYAEDVVICYDSDEAGQRATQRAIPILKKTGLRVKVVTMPGNKDPDEFMKTYGEDGPGRFRRLLETAGNDAQYRLSEIKGKYDLETEDGKSRYLQEAVSTVLGKMSVMERDIYAGRLAEETNVKKDSILSAAGRAAAKERKQEVKKLISSQMEIKSVKSTLNPEKEEHLRAALAEEGIIAYLFLHQDKAAILKEHLPPEKFVTAWNRRVYAVLLGKMIVGDVSLADFAEEFTGEEISELARILAEHGEVEPKWADVEEYSRILQGEKRFTAPADIKNAGTQDIQAYLENLRQQKMPKKQE